MIFVEPIVPQITFMGQEQVGDPVSRLCGLDEAGRGPLAGPLIAAAVILPLGFDFSARFPRVRFGDSKKLSVRQRNAAFELIKANALTFVVEKIETAEIDQRGIGWANRIIFERLINAIDADQYVVDGNLKLNIPPGKSVRCVVRADQTEQAVSAASIIAKVTRDQIMHELHTHFPEYHWNTNMGYGTPEHIAALREHGATPHHRQQYITTALAKPPKRPFGKGCTSP